MPELKLDSEEIKRCREAADTIADGVDDFIRGHTTTSVERAVLRLLGVEGADDEGVPTVNIMVDQLQEDDMLSGGAALPLAAALISSGLKLEEMTALISSGEENMALLARDAEFSQTELRKFVRKLAEKKSLELSQVREQRNDMQDRYAPGERPWKYVIVATGNIYEDVRQARIAAREGADIIAVIRSTAQSLLDYVPRGATTEGYGGTYATRENFRIMRSALDEEMEELGRYIQLVNYCSGLCMPEIAVMGARERLDMMLNDAMYGILFRDINMKRTFIDQYFSRLINAYSGIIINTGEDNYLTTADALEEAHTVIASQFINEELAFRSCLPPEQIGLGHAFELDPDLKDGFLLELAQAQLVRQLFPGSPLKYMPPTRYMTGDIFKGHLLDAMFNLTAAITDQDIQLLGMLTEAIHTPFVQDRALSLDNAGYIFNNAGGLKEEIDFSKNGRIQDRADEVLGEAVDMMEEIAEEGLVSALEKGRFASISRSPDEGKGADGVIAKDDSYFNPFTTLFREELEDDAI